jgi:hypothetical protein
VNELKECPFCGCDQIHTTIGFRYTKSGDIEYAEKGARVYCRNCRVSTWADTIEPTTYEEAVAAWNTRTQTVSVEDLRGVIKAIKEETKLRPGGACMHAEHANRRYKEGGWYAAKLLEQLLAKSEGEG